MLSWTVARSWPAPATGGWVGLPPPWAWVCREVTADLPDCLPLPSVRRTRDGCWQGPSCASPTCPHQQQPRYPTTPALQGCRRLPAAAAGPPTLLRGVLLSMRRSGSGWWPTLRAAASPGPAPPSGRPSASLCLTRRGAGAQTCSCATAPWACSPWARQPPRTSSCSRLAGCASWVSWGGGEGGRRVPADHRRQRAGSSTQRQQLVCFPCASH